MEKLVIQGQVQGFGFSYEREEPTFDEIQDLLGGAVSWLKGQGAEPYAAFSLSADANPANAQTSRPAANCPTHGVAKLKTWPDGATSCSAFSNKKETWSQDGKPNRNGGTNFYCAYRVEA